MTLNFTQKQRFLTFTVVGAVAVPGLALLMTPGRDVPAVLVSMLLAGLLAGAGWFATILYADATITEAFARADLAKTRLSAAREAVLGVIDTTDPDARDSALRELVTAGALHSDAGYFETACRVIDGEIYEVR